MADESTQPVDQRALYARDCSSRIKIRSLRRYGSPASSVLVFDSAQNTGECAVPLFAGCVFLLLAIAYRLAIGRGYYIEGFYPALFAAGAVALERELLTPRRARGGKIAISPRSSSPVCRVCAARSSRAARCPPTWRYEARDRVEPPRTARRQEPSDQSDVRRPARLEDDDRIRLRAPIGRCRRAQRAITAIFADRYAYAGALDYYGPRYGLPRVISPNNSYYLVGHSRL